MDILLTAVVLALLTWALYKVVCLPFKLLAHLISLFKTSPSSHYQLDDQVVDDDGERYTIFWTGSTKSGAYRFGAKAHGTVVWGCAETGIIDTYEDED